MDKIDGIEIFRIGNAIVTHVAVLPLVLRWRPEVIIDDLSHAMPWFTPLIPVECKIVAYFRHLHARTISGSVGPLTEKVLERVERLYPLLYRSSSFVTESRSSEEDLVRLGVLQCKISRIPPGVDTTTFRPRVRSSNPTVVYFGGWRPYKRPDHALRIFDRVLARVSNARLLMLGTGLMRPSVEAESHRIGLSEAVKFLGPLPTGELAEVLGSAWLNLHCSKAEGWCLSAIEAAASGVPTVAYAVPGLTDSVLDGKTGRLVPDSDIRAATEASVDVLVSSDRESWSSRCVEWARRFDWDLSTTGWELILKD
jgi:glycosyltransferase involved in cell wall biosynthesis